MKKLRSSLLAVSLVFSLMLPTLGWATAGIDKDCKDCSIVKKNPPAEKDIMRVCNDVSDIICKDVKLEERRGCNESDEYIFSNMTSKNDVFNFAQGCFKSGVTSFAKFFTDFLPKLLQGIWEATKATTGAAYGVATGDSNLWEKLKGMYESSKSVAADVYEAVQEDPGAYFSKIWSRIVDVVGPMVANYDCLKPQRKVENICGFIAEWIMPPAILAKILVRGYKEVKFLQAHGVLSVSDKGKLTKALEYAEKRSVLTLKEMQALEKSFVKLGYTADEFELMYKTGAFKKYAGTELKPLSTAEGRYQKKQMLGEPLAAKVAPKVEPAKAPVKVGGYDASSDFFTTTSIVGGNTVKSSGQIVERIIENGQEVGYRVRMIDARNKKVVEATFTGEQMARLNAKAASKEVADDILNTISKDKKFKNAEDEFLELQRKQNAELEAQKSKRAKLDGYEVKEIGMDEFEAAKAASQVKRYEDGVDYVPTASPGNIIKAQDARVKPKEPLRKVGEGPFKSGYLQVMTKNSMGVTTYMPAQVLKTVVEDGVEKYVIRILDKSTNTFKERKLSLPELSMIHAKDAPAAAKDIKAFDSAAGVNGLD